MIIISVNKRCDNVVGIGAGRIGAKKYIVLIVNSHFDTVTGKV